MIKSKNFALIIPARLNSSRLPGKVLKLIKNLTLLEHIYQNCIKVVSKENIFVATPDTEIIDLCREKKIRVIKTSNQCLTGTDRLVECDKILNKKFYINVQADEIFLNNQSIIKVYDEIKKNNYQIINCYKEIKLKSEFLSVNVPKVVFNMKNELMYMSRAPIPSNKNKVFSKSFKQVCVYGFTGYALKKFGELKKKTFFEYFEDIEILRFLEMGLTIKMIKVTGSKLSIDTKIDYLKAKKIIEKS